MTTALYVIAAAFGVIGLWALLRVLILIDREMHVSPEWIADQNAREVLDDFEASALAEARMEIEAGRRAS